MAVEERADVVEEAVGFTGAEVTVEEAVMAVEEDLVEDSAVVAEASVDLVVVVLAAAVLRVDGKYAFCYWPLVKWQFKN